MGEPGRVDPADRRIVLLGCFLVYESRAPDPMLTLGLFRRRNFSAGNIETFSMYAGLAILFFFLVLFLQQIGGYTPLQSGLAVLPATLVMFALSRRFGALADRFGPRLFMGAGPLVGACGLLLFQRVGVQVDYVSDVLPALLLFALGLSMTVAPLTAAVLAGAGEDQAGSPRASTTRSQGWGPARTAALALSSRPPSAQRLRAVCGARHWGDGPCGRARGQATAARAPRRACAARCTGRALTSAAEQASLHSFHLGMAVAAALVAAGGVVAWPGFATREARARRGLCRGQLVGASAEIARPHHSGRPWLSRRLARVGAHRVDDRPSRRPLGVSRYSTVGGLEGITLRSINPAASRSRRRSESMRGRSLRPAAANS